MLCFHTFNENMKINMDFFCPISCYALASQSCPSLFFKAWRVSWFIQWSAYISGDTESSSNLNLTLLMYVPPPIKLSLDDLCMCCFYPQYHSLKNIRQLYWSFMELFSVYLRYEFWKVVKDPKYKLKSTNS